MVPKVGSQIKQYHVCKWCHKSFVREATYINHECTQMKKDKELATVDGQAAWQYYHTWMMKKKRMPPIPGSFVTSNLFRTFINFAKFAKKVQLPVPNTFITWTIKKDYPPTMWMLDEIYTQYLEVVDNDIPPLEQVQTSFKAIFDYADIHDIDASDVFDVINPNELIQLVRVRKLSPWLLLFSGRFKARFSGLSEEQRAILETLIKPDVWAQKKEQYKSDINTIKLWVSELGI